MTDSSFSEIWPWSKVLREQILAGELDPGQENFELLGVTMISLDGPYEEDFVWEDVQ